MFASGRFNRMALLAAGTVTAAALATGSAQAADTDDPYVSGCATGAYAVAAANLHGSGNTPLGQLHLMYSPKCNENWAELDGAPRNVELKLLVWNANGSQENVIWDNSATIAWTDMVYGGVSAGASIDDADDGPYFVYQTGANPPGDMAL